MTTRDAVETNCSFRGRRLTLVDTAGVNRERSRRSNDFLHELHIRTKWALQRADVCVVCFDATLGPPGNMPFLVANMCADEGRPVLFCATKWDAVLDGSATAEAIDFQMRKEIGHCRQVNSVVVSATTGQNLALLLDQIIGLYDTWNKHVAAQQLSRFWTRLSKTVNIPSDFKIRRIKQVKTRPPTFKVHLQTRDEFALLSGVQTNLIRNAFAEEFGFKGVPIRLIQEVKPTRGDEIGRRSE